MTVILIIVLFAMILTLSITFFMAKKDEKLKNSSRQDYVMKNKNVFGINDSSALVELKDDVDPALNNEQIGLK